jgi:hypothetical protein
VGISGYQAAIGRYPPGIDAEHFHEIAKRFGPFDVAMIKIGQWHPSWGDIRLGPKDALDASALLDAKLFVPIHWGTFELAIHDGSEPAETLTIEAAKRGGPITAPMLGHGLAPPTVPWRRSLLHRSSRRRVRVTAWTTRASEIPDSTSRGSAWAA